MSTVFNLPELGDGIKEGTVINILVAAGERVKEGDTVVEVETDKAVIPVPINAAGTLSQWHVKEGASLKIGDKLCSLEAESPSEKEAPPPKTDSPQNFQNPQKKETGDLEVNFIGLGEGESGTVIALAVKIGDQVKEGDTLLEIETDKAVVPFPSPGSGIVKDILVKEGQEIKGGDRGLVLSGVAIPVTDAPPPVKSESPQPPEASEPSEPSEPPKKIEPPSPRSIREVEESIKEGGDGASAYAGPASRKLARELGVNLDRVVGSGRNRRIHVEDVKAYVKSITSSHSGGATSAGKELPDFGQWGGFRREKISKLRDTISRSIAYSWQTIPHVHQYDNIDIHAIYHWQKKWKNQFEEQGSIFSVTPFIIKALSQCLRDFPQFNSSFDPVSKEVIFKEYYHIGVAVDTPHGLIVPVIKDVDKMTIFDIGARLKTIASQTRERSVKPEDLRGACMTLSNLGGIGGTHFSPIINWPETAILGVGRGSMQPVYVKEKGEFVPTMILPACLAYDHRVIDGADGARFMVKLKNYLENPDQLLMGLH